MISLTAREMLIAQRLSSNVFAALLKDYGITDKIEDMLRPYITQIQAAVEKAAAEDDGEGKHHRKLEGLISRFDGLTLKAHLADMASNRIPDNLRLVLKKEDFKITVHLKDDSRALYWSNAMYDPLGNEIILNFNLALARHIANDPRELNRFRKDTDRFGETVKHEVTHALRDAETRVIRKFVKKKMTDPKV